MTFPGEPAIPPTDPSTGETPLVPPSPPRSQAGPEQPRHPAHPYPPAPPQGQGYPYAAPSWPPPAAAYGGFAQPQPAEQDPADALRRARTALGWAIGAAVGAFLALALAVVALLISGVSSAADVSDDVADDGSGYESDYYGPLRGEVVGLTEGEALPGSTLVDALIDLMPEYTPTVDHIACPDTAAVGISTGVVCSGEVEGYSWTGVVFFEGPTGTFVVLEL